MKAPHTPAPWNFSHGRISSRAHQTARDIRVAVICDLDMENDERGEQTANAKLIAASPDLLAALQSSEGLLYEAHSDLPDEYRAKRDIAAALKLIRAAITKATA